MASEIKFLSLQKTELTYEVEIRGATPATTVPELRRQITGLSQKLHSEDLLTSPFDPCIDIKGVLETLQKLNTTLIPSSDKNTLLRSQNVLRHVYYRLRRISPTESCKAEFDECIKLYKDYNTKLTSLMSEAIDPLDLLPQTSSIREPVNSNPFDIHVSCDGNNHSLFAKLKYDGNSCVHSFVQRAGEYCAAKNIKSEKIFNNATEIFTGNALHWFRAVRDTITNWDDLLIALKRDFSIPDFDYKLMSEIRSRTQGEKENILVYLSIMAGLFSKLSKPLLEEDKLEILFHNIRPCYANSLSCVTEITSIDQLKEICRNYEKFHSRSTNFKEPPRVNQETLAPELAYSSSSSGYNNKNFKKPFNNYYNKNNSFKNQYQPNTSEPHANVNSLQTNYNRFCVRCKSKSHSFYKCNADKSKIFCFRCGLKDVKSPNCPKCKPNNDQQSKN